MTSRDHQTLYSHFLETDPELNPLGVRVSEAEAVPAVPLLCRGEVLAVLLLAAPPEARAGVPGVAHVLQAGVPSRAVRVQGAGRVEGDVPQGGGGGGETEDQGRHEPQLVQQARHDQVCED